MQPDADRLTGTRRDAIRYCGAVAGAGLLAGCSGRETTPSGSENEAGSADGGSGGDSPDTYTAAMAPVGEVEFDAVPESVSVYSLLYADLAVALGHGGAVNSLGFDADAGGNTLDAYYANLDGVSFDREGITQLNSGSGGGISVDRELLYELDSDLHLADPALFASFDGWDEEDVAEVRERVGPWFGNSYSRRHAAPPEAYRDRYEYYTLPEIGERVAAAFRESERFAALDAVREDLIETIRSDLPPAEERPTVATLIYMDGTYYPSRTDEPGFANAHVRPFDVPDAFAGDDVTYETAYDHERLLEVDPDVVLHQYGIASYYDVGAVREELSDHPVAGDLSAIANDRFYPSGDPVQGPIMNLFQLEMTAKQLFPERFGEWPTYERGDDYPEIPADEQLFDRGEVASIVAGGGE
ncbi:ABC transporter substrate-binding protein [Halorubrum ezzemoulense]|uniref:ABC transporter substrate-binding protein n=1 Tax=Halorubrum TaxID=56688 RepID=UPI0010F549DF|nr:MULTISPECIES: ABC transporter substrate-binding protein [Halorubrum]MDB2263460.1 ABC transporter substrate-binding protein [Halorubrum ezzemoulense]MDB2283195.1 ABC transporter substrate-binding protein [Halorubrum ezzemoulense]MDB9233625.1 ABC transporter substrate-binding protein [Halorubrum ezzemoulense]MDB9249411.1 ABC transporter substrate-binding protein [Halorubrum ezzemoulense]MDB9257631.1 ABC transporter substrate-binding protein [Halorubrum ezzemoulense]